VGVGNLGTAAGVAQVTAPFERGEAGRDVHGDAVALEQHAANAAARSRVSAIAGLGHQGGGALDVCLQGAAPAQHQVAQLTAALGVVGLTPLVEVGDGELGVCSHPDAVEV